MLSAGNRSGAGRLSHRSVDIVSEAAPRRKAAAARPRPCWPHGVQVRSSGAPRSAAVRALGPAPPLRAAPGGTGGKISPSLGRPAEGFLGRADERLLSPTEMCDQHVQRPEPFTGSTICGDEREGGPHGRKSLLHNGRCTTSAKFVLGSPQMSPFEVLTGGTFVKSLS